MNLKLRPFIRSMGCLAE